MLNLMYRKFKIERLILLILSFFCLVSSLIIGQAFIALADMPENNEAEIEPEVFAREMVESTPIEKPDGSISREKREEMISEAKAAIKSNKPDDAEKIINRLLAINPADQKALQLKEQITQLRHVNTSSELDAIMNEERLKNLEILDEQIIPYTKIMRFPDEKDMEHIQKRTVPDSLESFEAMKEKTARLSLIPEPKKLAPKDIDEALNTKISFEFAETSLRDVIAFLREKTGINIVIETAITESMVNLKLDNVTIKTALKYILPDGVSYIVEDDVVYILNDRLEMRVYDVRDLLINLDDRAGVPGGEAGGGGAAGEARNANQRVKELIRLITAIIEPQSWSQDRGRITTREDRPGDLIVINVDRVHKQIGDLLTSMRSSQHIQVSIEARFIQMTDKFLEDIGIEIQNASISNESAGTKLDFDVDTSAGVAGGAVSQGLNLTYSILKDYQIDILLNAVQESVEAEMLSSPRITLSNTQRGNIRVVNEISYVSSYEIISQVPQPIIGVVEDGIIFDVRPVISTDRKHVFLEVHPNITVVTFESLPFSVAVPFTSLQGTEFQTLELTIEQPLVRRQELSVTVDVPDRGMLMIGGLGTTEKVKRTGGIPILSKIPLIKRLFTRDSETIERTNLIILLKPIIIIREEEMAAREEKTIVKEIKFEKK